MSAIAAAPAWLIYGQGGGAWAQSRSEVTFAGVQIGDFSKTRSGWTAGGGVEWMFAPRWSAFLEGNYMDFGSNDQTVFASVSCPAGCAFSAKTTAATALVGVNYRFRVGQSALLEKHSLKPPRLADEWMWSWSCEKCRRACPLWVISGHLQGKTACPLYPRKRTCAVHQPMSALCNSGHFLCGVQVNDQIEFGCLFHTQIARVGALQHSIYNASWGLWTRP